MKKKLKGPVHPISTKDPRYLACGCHLVGKRIAIPETLFSLEKWRRDTAKSRKEFGDYPPVGTRTADDTVEASRESALVEEWFRAHPWIMERVLARQSKGEPSPRIGRSSAEIVHDHKLNKFACSPFRGIPLFDRSGKKK